ncbi:uncharacterized protein BDR25DRAFT_328989 [Lindgomyces ingoldianus]|uniref:Uncharacterized protein n=1 Tax=Lindgomyces ingoldianus TaxID=673940 RepID=A0ACB6QD84_9PLEO|nr:uncharacterized protein BDR25DRAFT_328989 [Lindgomyces ingoldianus]KAF2464944.1 hypothetical protein BDR25DRAFT_328989 [Lindgomyces ingoldianus]
MTSHSSSQSDIDAKLKDLKRYIALGCLHLDKKLLIESDPRIYDSDWIELVPLHLSDEAKTIIGNDTLKLLQATWIRLFINCASITALPDYSLLRIYLLPNDRGRRFIDRQSKSLKSALRNLLHRVDVSSEAWNGVYGSQVARFDPWASPENVSLFYLFNMLPSPAPSPQKIKSRYTRIAGEELLESCSQFLLDGYEDQPLCGLKTRLYPYQARSAALMIQREATPELRLDPRLEVRHSPTGEEYFFGAKDGSFLQEPRYYETNRGGILAETMGLGKTVICLAVILATKGHVPQIPPAYQPTVPTRQRVGSLSEMVASIIGRYSIPGRAHLERMEVEEGIDLGNCKTMLDQNIHYEIPAEHPRMNRTTRIPPPRKLVLCSGTLIVVPRNLLHQWQGEIRKHVCKGSLKILIMDSKPKRNTKKKNLLNGDEDMEPRSELPSTTDLMKYDIIIFTRNRFEQEIQDGADEVGRRLASGAPLECQCPYIGASRVRDCRCLTESGIYESALKKLHWLRIIIDEGHNFSSGVSNAVLIAKQIRAERRWVVSGTPAKDLVGVEVDMSTLDTQNDEGNEPSLVRNLAIEQRKNFSIKEDKTGAAKALGSLASNFLMVRPWCDSTAEGKLDWDDYIYRHEDHHRKTYSGFSTSFLRTLEGLVVKTRPEDVERDIKLPPMTHRVVYLKPCWFDKMTANLFIQVLRANAITSERSDVDYLFHKNSLKARHSLIRNLRQSNFVWTGFSLDDVASTLETSSNYLGKEDNNCSLEDAKLLLQSSQIVSNLLNSPEWIALSKAHEVGLAIENWPQNSEMSFALAYPNKPAMIGITQLLEGQAYVDSQILSEDPSEGLKAVGEEAKAKLVAIEEAERARVEKIQKHEESEHTRLMAGVPSSCVGGQPLTSRKTAATTFNASPKKPKQPIANPNPSDTLDTPAQAEAIAAPASPIQAKKKRRLTLADEMADLPPDSPLLNTRVIGTTSAKLSYLIEAIVTHQSISKILIFYDGDNTAFYLAQCMEMLYVGHRIYAKSLGNEVRSQYVALFNEDPEIRVLLIDVACGALGLNLNAANLVYIVNPINRPHIEAQAIKRAHRIGQTKEVVVETLVLKGTIEEAIFTRAKKMSRDEHLEAKTLEDDNKIIDIIQNAKVITIDPGESCGVAQFAALNTPQQVFGRPGRHKYQKFGNTDAKGSEKSRKRQRVTQNDSIQNRENEGASLTAPPGAATSHLQLPILTPHVPAPSLDTNLQTPFQSLFGNPLDKLSST